MSPINSQYAGDATTNSWYAPAARAIVRSISHNPYLGPITVDLLDFRLQPESKSFAATSPDTAVHRAGARVARYRR
jgi:hypothetical protein